MKDLAIIGRLIAFVVFPIGLLFLLFNLCIGLLIIIASIVVWNICGYYLTKKRNLEDQLKSEIEKIIGNKITAFFMNGKLYRVSPPNSESYYDAKYIVSDNKLYDLENIEDITRIPIPEFKQMGHDNYGVTGLLDYVLRMKAGAFYNRKEKELCSACLWKATEMMFCDSLCSWSKRDYIRLIYWHMDLGMDDEAERAKKYLESKGMIFTEHEIRERKYASSMQSKNPVQRKHEKPKDKISQIEKEHIMVKNVTTDDMQKLNMPFVCNTEIKKDIREEGHPFAYMEILGENISIVKAEIKKMNAVIKESIKAYSSIPQDLRIPENEIVFQPQNYGYTRIMCTPKTFTGRPSKYPYSLFFCTDLSKSGNTRHGELYYGKDGTIQKATVCFWENSNGFFLNFKMIDGKLTFTGLGQNKPEW